MLIALTAYFLANHCLCTYELLRFDYAAVNLKILQVAPHLTGRHYVAAQVIAIAPLVAMLLLAGWPVTLWARWSCD